MGKFQLLERAFLNSTGGTEAQDFPAGAIVVTNDTPPNTAVPLDEEAALAKAAAIQGRGRSGIRVSSSNQYRRAIARSLGIEAMQPDQQIEWIEKWLLAPTPIAARTAKDLLA